MIIIQKILQNVYNQTMLKPLAFRMRPKLIEDIIGQEHLVGENGFLRRSIEEKIPVSFILFGEPGTGKTTIAECYVNSLHAKYKLINAVTSNKKEIVDAIDEAKNYECFILIIDEIHRLNKDKQDILLPAVENGTVYLIGATTANPYISINKAIRSRLHLLEVKKLSNEQLVFGLKKAISSPNGLNNKLDIDDEALLYIAKQSNGDFRYSLNYLEIVSINFKNKKVNLSNVKEIIRVPNSSLDDNDDGHYDAVSAMQKSIRGGDVNAAIYYASRLLSAGDLDSLTRRLLVTAYEDIGIANPQACLRTKIAIESAYEVGLPEAIIPLSVAIVDLALSPKSKAACLAMERAFEETKDMPLDVLDYLKFTPVNVQEEDRYPYDEMNVWPHLQYLPEIIKNKKFFIPNENATSSYEKFLNEQYKKEQNTFKTKNIREAKKLYGKKK